MTPQSPDSADDRRRFFRIDDTVRISIRAIEPSQLAQRVAELEQGPGGNFSVMSSLEAVTAKMTAGLRRIESRDPDLAAYLRALDQKIEILGRAFLAQDSELVSDEAQPVNISAGGVSLYSRTALAVGQPVEIRMLLFPSFTGVLSYGEVIGCDPLPAGEDDRYSYQLRVEFVHLREQEREVLIRHVLRRQGEALQAQRTQQEADAPGD